VTGADPFNLQRFVEAQSGGVYEQAVAELRDGRKRGHWMWFIFPQHVDLGRSPTAKYFGLSGVDEATAYLRHPLLGDRLIACCDELLLHLLAGKTARAVLGDVDALKLRSSMRIFLEAEDQEYRFAELLDLAGRDA
jgi:uncharacterized protein (DUF1810 family)